MLRVDGMGRRFRIHEGYSRLIAAKWFSVFSGMIVPKAGMAEV
jgi:hypothetical protein